MGCGSEKRSFEVVRSCRSWTSRWERRWGIGLVWLCEHEAGQTERNEDENRSERTKKPVGEEAADDCQRPEVCD